MGITDFFSDLMASMSFTEAHADAPAEEEETPAEESEEKEEGGEEEAAEEEEAEVEEEEEEDDEPVDLKPKLEEECARSAQCSGYKHHFEECVERVTSPKHTGPKEDCVEEFFHLQHCATACAAPRLFKNLK